MNRVLHGDKEFFMAETNCGRIKLEYIKAGDYLVPNLIPNQEPMEPLTKYGILRREFLKTEREGRYTSMLFKGELQEHCLSIQKQAQERLELIMDQMAKAEGVDEKLKAEDQMAWVRRMNNIKARAEEIVLTEIVYA